MKSRTRKVCHRSVRQMVVDGAASRRHGLLGEDGADEQLVPDAVRMHGVIHCLPGPLSRKAVAVANVAAVLAPTGVLFGASILGPSGPHTWLSRMILDANNRRGIFDNLGDTQDGLREILEASFEQVELETVGSMAIFAAMNPRT